MTWLAELARRGWPAFAAWLMLATVAFAASDATNAPAPALSSVVSNALPAWMEVSVLATNAAEWADLADIWRHPDPNASPVENLTLPVEHYDNGRIRAVLYANKAFMGNAGMIWSWNVTVDMFDPAGAPDGRVEAESCLYDRNARRGYCPAAVKLVRTNATIDGIGMYWTMDTRRMQLLSNPVVRLRKSFNFPGIGPVPTNKILRSEGNLPQGHNFSGGGTPK
jgi:hypothetical protein